MSGSDHPGARACACGCNRRDVLAGASLAGAGVLLGSTALAADQGQEVQRVVLIQAAASRVASALQQAELINQPGYQVAVKTALE